MFAWAQTRLNLPGWYGLGSGLAAVIGGPGRAGRGAEAYQGWPLLAVLLDNAEMSLAKTDRRIAARHLALGGRDDLTAQVLAEYDLTRRLVLEVTGHDRLLANRPVLSRAVALRDPYVDALSHLQLRALNWAAGRAAAMTAHGRGQPGAAGTPAAAARSAASPPACRTPADRPPPRAQRSRPVPRSRSAARPFAAMAHTNRQRAWS